MEQQTYTIREMSERFGLPVRPLHFVIMRRSGF